MGYGDRGMQYHEEGFAEQLDAILEQTAIPVYMVPER